MADLCEETYAQSFIRYVNLELDEVKRNFIKIGFRLNEADSCRYYKELGYNDIIELAEAEFGFKKSTTYGLMKLNKMFCSKDDPMHLAERYKDFSYTQLLVLSSAKWVGSEFWHIVKSSDSVSKLKSFVSNWNSEYKTGCGFHPSLKTVDDYLKYAEQKNKSQISLPLLDSKDNDDEFSNRLENSNSENVIPTEINFNNFGASNIEYIRIAPIVEIAKKIVACVCCLPDTFGEGFPYEHRLEQWLQVWLLSRG